MPPTERHQFGGFRVIAELGQGAMGRVFLGYGPDGRWAAVKVIHGMHVADAGFRARFREEVAASQQVSGGYTAAVLDADSESPTPWMASEFLLGPTLREATEKTGGLPEEALVRLAAGLATALAEIHRAGIVHRDLKPGNVILTGDGPRVIDFGIARALARTGTDLTRTGGVIGTPEFMSPEQVESRPLTPASDMFALGSVLAAAASGASPFAAPATFHVLTGIVRAEPDLSGLPGRLRALVAPCLAADPRDRPTPAGLLELIGRLEPTANPWPDPVVALAHSQRRQLTELLTRTPAHATRLDDGPTLVVDPDRPTWAETPSPSATRPPEQRRRAPIPQGPHRTGPEAPPRTVRRARRLAWWCLPGFVCVLAAGVLSLGAPGSPKAVIAVNIVLAAASIATVMVGNRWLLQRRTAGVGLIAAATAVAALQAMTIPLQASLTGADFPLDSNDPVETLLSLLLYFYASAATIVAIAGFVYVMLPATRNWCRTHP
nr:serine/threonine-protein kinase [Glycomyces sambucus]